MVRVSFFVHIHRATASATGGVDTFVGRIEGQFVAAFPNRKSLQLFACHRVKNHNRSTSAGHKQAVIWFIQRQCKVRFTEGNWPA